MVCYNVEGAFYVCVYVDNCVPEREFLISRILTAEGSQCKVKFIGWIIC